MIDTHCHLYDEAFDTDRDNAVRSAVEAGVSLMLLPAIDSLNHPRQEALAEAFPNYFRQMMGLHPTSVSADPQTELDIVQRKLFECLNVSIPDCLSIYSDNTQTIKQSDNQTIKQSDNQTIKQSDNQTIKQSDNQTIKQSNNQTIPYVAVGEIGLDLYWDKTYLDQQLYALRQQLEWADQLHLPVCLHVRKAHNELFALLRQINRPQYSGVMHCFGGSVQEAHRAVEMGFHIGIGGVVTFKNATLASVAREVPLDRILLETDAPYLAPVPHRGQRNESAYIPLIAAKIAEIRGITLQEVDETTTEAACRLFNLYSSSEFTNALRLRLMPPYIA